MLRSCTVGGRVPLDHVGGCRPLVVGYTVKVVGVGHPYRNRNRNRNRAGHPQGGTPSGERRGVGGRCHVLRLYLPCVASGLFADKWHVLR